MLCKKVIGKCNKIAENNANVARKYYVNDLPNIFFKKFL